MFKLLVTGDKNFDNFSIIRKYIEWSLSKKELHDVEIVSNSNCWVEKLSEVYTMDKHVGSLQVFNKNNYESIFEYVDATLIFWDGKNIETKEIIDTANKLEKKIKVVSYLEKDLLGFSEKQMDEIIKYLKEIDIFEAKKKLLVNENFSFIEYIFSGVSELAEKRK